MPTERLVRLAFEARDLCKQIDFVGWQVSAGTRAMLERVGALATQEAHEADEAAAHSR